MAYQEMSPLSRAWFDATHDPEYVNWGQDDWNEKEEWASKLLPQQRVAPIRTLASPQEIALELQGVPQAVARRIARHAIEGLADAG